VANRLVVLRGVPRPTFALEPTAGFERNGTVLGAESPFFPSFSNRFGSGRWSD